MKNGFGYFILVVAAAWVAGEYFRPMGQYVHDVFQTLVDAFSHK